MTGDSQDMLWAPTRPAPSVDGATAAVGDRLVEPTVGAGDAATAADAAAAQPIDPTPVAGIVMVRRRRRWVRRATRGGLTLVVLGLGYYGITLYQVHSTGTSDQTRPVQAIVVMGAAQYDGRPSPQLAARLDHVVQLWNEGVAPIVVVTGGKRTGDRFTEAEASQRYLTDRGVPAPAILEENEAHNSYDSLRGVRDLLAARNVSRVLLVSDPYHSLRIRLVSQELGMTAYVSPTRTSPVTGSRELAKELKEAAGISLGRIIGFRRLLSITG